MKRTRIYAYTTTIDSNYSAHKGYIPIPRNVKNIKSVCPVLHNAEGYISLLKELDEEQILNEMRIEDDKMHINSKKVDVSVTPDNSDIKFILKLSKIFRDKKTIGVSKSLLYDHAKAGESVAWFDYRYSLVGGGAYDNRSSSVYEGKEYTDDKGKWVLQQNQDPKNIYDTICTLKIIIEYEEDV
ncbi:MAG: hypothetical protein II956_16005 [Bacteroidales bacterium]|nr:hypothetical protein [Bacteroidales bacterium]